MDYDEKDLEIIKYYDVLPQLKYFQSEVYELTEAIIQCEDDEYKYYDEIDKYYKKHITEEIADCLVMIRQFQLYYGIKDVDVKTIMQNKIDRQTKRIKEQTRT